VTLSIRARLTAWHTGVLIATLAAAALVILTLERSLALASLDDTLARTAATVESVVVHELAENMSVEAAAGEAGVELGTMPASVVISRPDGTVLARWGVPLPAPWTPAYAPAARTVSIGGQGYRGLDRPVAAGGHDFVVTVLAPLLPLERQQRELREALAAGILVALLVAGAGGWLVGRHALAPLRRMARDATAIDDRHPDVRLHVPHPADELGRLGLAFNALLDRLAGALHAQRQFMADASHQMRTPVSVLQTTSQVMLRQPRRDEREYRESLAIVGEQSARLARLVDAMFLMARSDAGGRTIRTDLLYFDELVDECARAASVLAAEHGVRVDAGGDADVAFTGDDELLRHMVVNLLENAVRHTPPGGAVRTEVSRDAEGIRLRVFDTGPGIPEADRERIFERFVQLESRSAGAGLGLPMARWIAREHGGTLALESTGPSGSCFLVCLPFRQPSSPAAATAVPPDLVGTP
jgi:signal transduction histidine kinase